MTENTKTKFSDLQELIKFCNNAVDNLDNFHGQLVKIIEVKKKLSTSTSGNMVFNQALDVSNTLANLEKINSRLSGAISEMKQLSRQAVLLSQAALGQGNVSIAKQKDAGKG